MFLTFCENYGVPKTNLCQTVDLYEGTNMPQFLSAVQCLGTEVSFSTPFLFYFLNIMSMNRLKRLK